MRVKGGREAAAPSGAEPLGWSLRVDGALPGVVNMARDHAAALTLPPGSALLRLYRWERPTLSLGRHEPARGVYDPGRLAAAGVDVVRRPTGGRAVLHWRELTYAVVLPDRALGGARASYRLVHDALAGALDSLGVPVAIAAPRGPALPPHAGPCFREPAPGELVAGGRKLVGSAQVRLGATLLQHGSILLEDDQGLLERLGGGVGEPPATLRGVLGRVPGESELERAIVTGFGRVLGARFERDAGAAADAVAEEERLALRYAASDWTWRR